MTKIKPVWIDDTARGHEGSMLKLNSLRIDVHRLFGYDPKIWFVTCHGIGIEKKELGLDDTPAFRNAKKKALYIVRARAQQFVDELNAVKS